MYVSLDFLLIIFPLILLGFIIIRRILPSFCPIYLVILLYIFLYIIDFLSFILVFITANINYLLVIRIRKSQQPKYWIILGIIIALIPFLGFKFGQPFFIDDFSESSILFTWGMPIGLSFYALQQITAIIDCRKTSLPLLSYSRHLLYLGFFPNFIAGPIYTYREAVKPLSSIGYKAIPNDWVGNGLVLFLAGLFKKLWIANPIGGAIEHMITEIQNPDIHLTLFEAWFIVWGFLVQLYFDFSAYSDMAIGLALCFGVLLPINFDSPLKSANAQEYIARWHISFTSFIREYFFIPMLGLLKKLPIQNTEHRMFVAWTLGLFFSYMLIGIWHSPNLVIMSSSILVIFILFAFKVPRLFANNHTSKQISKTPHIINRLALLLFSMLMAICLKTQDIDILKMIYSSLINFNNISISPMFQAIIPTIFTDFFDFNGFLPSLKSYHIGTYIFTMPKMYILTLLLATIIIFFTPNTMQLFEIKKARDHDISFRWGRGIYFYFAFIILYLAVLFAFLFENHQIQNFIYENY